MEDDTLARLLAAPDHLAVELDGLSESELVRRPDEGGWNLKQLSLHLSQTERMYFDRLQRILQEDRPELQLFDQEQALNSTDAEHAGFGDALAEWKSWREQLVAVLEGLDGGSASRVGLHPELGEITPRGIARILDEHDQSHYRQALSLKALSRPPAS